MKLGQGPKLGGKGKETGSGVGQADFIVSGQATSRDAESLPVTLAEATSDPIRNGNLLGLRTYLDALGARPLSGAEQAALDGIRKKLEKLYADLRAATIPDRELEVFVSQALRDIDALIGTRTISVASRTANALEDAMNKLIDDVIRRAIPPWLKKLLGIK